ncbi:MAG: heavy metal-associated domain-containing protein, partial [bacterium]|nr:heavy metal-associated domain-containing protein [bacterium]
MHTETYKIKGMHCASCAGIIEKTLKKTEGVQSVEANYGTETAKIIFDDSKTNPSHLSQTIEKLGYTLVVPVADTSTMPSASTSTMLSVNTSTTLSAGEMGMSESEHAAHLGLSQSTHSAGSGLMLSSAEVSKKEKL